MTNENTGRCLCGGVEMKFVHVAEVIGACHCSMCRRWGGGPLLAVDCGHDVSISGDEHVSVYNSSEWAERGFCRHCGTHLFYRLRQTGQYIVPVGLLENSEGLVMDHQIFIDEKPGYYCFANETSNMTGAEVFALYSDSQS